MANWSSTTSWLSNTRPVYGNEADLVRAAQRGDRRAFQQLVTAYDHLVLSFALNVTQSEQDARLIYEQVFLDAFRALPGVAFGTSLFIWFYRLAAACCEKHLRHISTKNQTHAKLADYALTQLSVRERLVFVLAHHGHLRSSTIADILGISEIQAKEALIRAIYKLRSSAATAA